MTSAHDAWLFQAAEYPPERAEDRYPEIPYPECPNAENHLSCEDGFDSQVGDDAINCPFGCGWVAYPSYDERREVDHGVDHGLSFEVNDDIGW